VVDDPWLAALLQQYATTIGRLQTSFVGPEHFQPPTRCTPEAFKAAYNQGGGSNDQTITEFVQLQARTRAATGFPPPDSENVYQRYLEWLPYQRRAAAILDRVASRHAIGHTSGGEAGAVQQQPVDIGY
jgi:hypothetical protein